MQNFDSSAETESPHYVAVEGAEAPEQVLREECLCETAPDSVSRHSMQPSIEEVQDEEFIAHAHPNCMAFDEVPRSATPAGKDNYSEDVGEEDFEPSEARSETNNESRRVSPGSKPDVKSTPIGYAAQHRSNGHTRRPQLYWFEADRENWNRSDEAQGRREQRYCGEIDHTQRAQLPRLRREDTLRGTKPSRSTQVEPKTTVRTLPLPGRRQQREDYVAPRREGRTIDPGCTGKQTERKTAHKGHPSPADDNGIITTGTRPKNTLAAILNDLWVLLAHQRKRERQ